ncbi:hypothetical protein V6Z12_A13G148600 [Gossypium hirsutum]
MKLADSKDTARLLFPIVLSHLRLLCVVDSRSIFHIKLSVTFHLPQANLNLRCFSIFPPGANGAKLDPPFSGTFLILLMNWNFIS